MCPEVMVILPWGFDLLCFLILWLPQGPEQQENFIMVRRDSEVSQVFGDEVRVVQILAAVHG